MDFGTVILWSSDSGEVRANKLGLYQERGSLPSGNCSDN